MSRRYGQWVEDDGDDTNQPYTSHVDTATAAAATTLMNGLSPGEWQSQLNEHISRARRNNAAAVSSLRPLGLEHSYGTSAREVPPAHIMIDTVEATSSTASARAAPVRATSAHRTHTTGVRSTRHQLRDMLGMAAAKQKKSVAAAAAARPAWQASSGVTPSTPSTVSSSKSDSVLAKGIRDRAAQRHHPHHHPEMEQLESEYRQIRARVDELKLQLAEEKQIATEFDVKIAEQQATVDITARMKGLVRVSAHQPRYERATPEAFMRADRDAAATSATSSAAATDASIQLLAASERLLNLRVQDRMYRDKRETLRREVGAFEAEMRASGIADTNSSDALLDEYEALQQQLVSQRKEHLDMRLNFAKQIQEAQERSSMLESQLKEQRELLREAKSELASAGERRDLLQRKLQVLHDLHHGSANTKSTHTAASAAANDTKSDSGTTPPSSSSSSSSSKATGGSPAKRKSLSKSSSQTSHSTSASSSSSRRVPAPTTAKRSSLSTRAV